VNLLASVSILAAAAEHEDPSRTHSWIWPEGAEILWGTLAFLVVAYLLWKLGWPQAKKMMQARSARIQQQLDDASTAKTEADEAAVEIRRAKGDIESERARLLAEADQQAERMLVDGRARLDQEVAELRAKAESDVAATRTRAVSELQGEVAQVAAVASDRLVTGALDDELQQALIEEFIARVGASTP
jgi:F-type H+-transporting ATPase subunit b